MEWVILAVGVVLIVIGVGGQTFGLRKRNKLASYDRPARLWIVTVAFIVVGLWAVAFSAAHFLSLHATGHWGHW